MGQSSAGGGKGGKHKSAFFSLKKGDKFHFRREKPVGRKRKHFSTSGERKGVEFMVGEGKLGGIQTIGERLLLSPRKEKRKKGSVERGMLFRPHQKN